MFSTGMRFLASVALLLITISASYREGRAQELSVSNTTLTTPSTTSTSSTVLPDSFHKDGDNHNGGSGGKDDDHSGSQDGDDGDDDSDEWWPILVGVLGGLAAVVLIAVVAVAISRRHRKRQRMVYDSTTSLQQQQQQQVTGMQKGREQSAKISDPPPAYPDQLRVDVESMTRAPAPLAPILPPPYYDNLSDPNNVHQRYVQVMPGCNVTIYENKVDLSADSMEKLSEASVN